MKGTPTTERMSEKIEMGRVVLDDGKGRTREDLTKD